MNSTVEFLPLTSNRAARTQARGVDGVTSIRIRYESPPRRSEEEGTLYLAEGRQMGRYAPRHTPPDACAAQDVALDKPAVLKLAVRGAIGSRRDSGITSDAPLTTKDHVSDSEGETELQPRYVLLPDSASNFTMRSTSSIGLRFCRTVTNF
jgi:hypothetical protein